MKTFYQKQRVQQNVLLDAKKKPEGGKWSLDGENRKKLPKTQELPDRPQVERSSVVLEVSAFVADKFSDHPGDADHFWLPTTRAESSEWVERFVETYLENFGSYQDSITSRSDFVFHSTLSPMINVGLICPKEIVRRVEQAFYDSPTSAPLNSVEGFVRQVLGWREFVRGVYQNFSEHQWNTNFWGHTNSLTSLWYSGETGIPVLDDSIKKAAKYSMNHHIERLMVISNLMLLCEIHPHEVYRWFMEMYADSSDWVMGPNVFGMGQYSDGGVFATKPYICGSNYYLKMSDYKKGDWCEIVDGLYWRFIFKNVEFYKKNPRMAIMVKSLEKMDKDRQARIFGKAEEFISKVTC